MHAGIQIQIKQVPKYKGLNFQCFAQKHYIFNYWCTGAKLWGNSLCPNASQSYKSFVI